MRTLVIGGTGLISRGIVKHLLARGAQVRAFNRGKCAGPPLPAGSTEPGVNLGGCTALPRGLAAGPKISDAEA